MGAAIGNTPTDTRNFLPSSLAPGAGGATVTPAGQGRGGPGFFKTSGGVVIAPGQSLHYTPGKGYWAGPDPNAPSATPPAGSGPASAYEMTPAQMGADAASQATAKVKGEAAPINTEIAQNQSLGAAQDYQDTQFASAASKILGSIGPQVQQGYDTAARDTSAFAKAAGFGGLAPTLQDEQNGQAQFLSQVGQSGPSGPQFNSAQALGADLGTRKGFIPAAALAHDAAAARTWATGLKGVDVANAATQLRANDATTQANQAKLQDKLSTIAAKYPQYFDAAYHADIVTSLKAVGIDAAHAEKAAALAEKYVHDNITATHDWNMDNNAHTKTVALIAQGWAKARSQAIHWQNEDTTAAATQAAEAVHWGNEDTHAADMAKIALKKVALGWSQLGAKIKYENGELKIQGKNADANYLRAQVASTGIDLNTTKALDVVMLKNGKPLYVKGKDGLLHTVTPDPRIYGKAGKAGSAGSLTSNEINDKVDSWTRPLVKTERVQATDANGKPAFKPGTDIPEMVSKSVVVRPAYTFSDAISELTGGGTDHAKALRAVWGNPTFRHQGTAILQAAAAGYIQEGWTYKRALTDALSRGIFPRSIAIAILKPAYAKAAADRKYVKSMDIKTPTDLNPPSTPSPSSASTGSTGGASISDTDWPPRRPGSTGING